IVLGLLNFFWGHRFFLFFLFLQQFSLLTSLSIYTQGKSGMLPKFTRQQAQKTIKLIANSIKNTAI
ncbi:hypothetical protein, partial [Synechocystis salina]|uniref:hypothetical protein n=1 Tax=Synechocystis salina TaxID=945780 RepID=UPI001D133028